MLRKLYLLLWKNLLYFKRHPISTAKEIILPCFLAIALAYWQAQDWARILQEYGNGTTGDNNTNYDPNENTGLPDPGGRNYNNNPNSERDIVFPVYNETEFIGKLAREFNLAFFRKTVILYTPKSEAAERMIGKLVERIDRFLNATERLVVNITDFPNEAKMVDFHLINLVKGKYETSSLNIPFGLVFDGLSGNDVGPKVSYKIRMNHEFKTNILMNADYHPATYGRNEYIESGFIGIQYLLDEILIEEYTNAPLPANTFSLQAFPYPPDKAVADVNKGVRPQGINQPPSHLFQSFYLVIVFVGIVPQVMKGVVSEKETGIKEFMKMSGLPEWMHWLGWMLNSLAMLTVTVIIIVFFLFYPFNSTNGAVFEHSDVTLFWIVLMIYMIWAITYCFVVAACFEKTVLAMTFGIVIWFVSYLALAMPMGSGYGKDFSTGLKLLFCLFPNVAIHLATKAIIGFDSAGIGSKWENINQTIPSIVDVPLLYIILMFLASICLNMILCLYIEAILPKTYGVRKPFYFLFLPSEWGFSNRVSPSPLANDSSSTANKKPGFEDDPSGINAGVQIKNLRKEFGNGKVAVNDLTMNIFEGQILCLLGQNGAGKTTTMSILTGLIPPTSGTAFIDGYDIGTNMNKIRENLGLCPQHNMLFDDMTVIEHLQFFGMLKGLSSLKAEREGGDLVRVLQIEKTKYQLSTSLSGGQKRRLHLGCALIGGSKVIFLDEPTSGLDPEGRRAIWDILLKIRGERTIVLTTHFMEEADVLGDRIAILANGSLQCCGTSNFLKRFYGAGYTLNMTLTDGANPEEILQTVCKHIGDAHFKASHSNNATELSIALPSDSNTTAKFPNLFSELHKEQNKLHIDDIGVGWSTMDEVFVRVEELSHPEEDTNYGPTTHQNGTGPMNEGPKHDKLTGLKLIANQFYGLLLKKLFQTMRQKRLSFTQMLVPIILIIGAISLAGTIDTKNDSKANPALKMLLSLYNGPVTLYSSENQALGDSYAKVVGASAEPLDSSYNNNISLGLLAAGLKDAADYHERYIVAAQLNDTNMKGMHSPLAYHSASLSLNLLTNTFLQSKGKGTEVEITNHPFQQNFHRLLFNSPNPMLIVIVAGLLPLGLMLLLGTFIIGPTEERISKGKQLQLMTGVHPFLYWLSTVLWDMLIVLISISFMTACLPIFDRKKLFTSHHGAGVLFLIMTAYTLASILFTYIFSTFVKGVARGFYIITIINIYSVVLGLASFAIETFEGDKFGNPNQGIPLLLRTIGRVFPTSGFTKASVEYVQISAHNSFCHSVSKKALDLFCVPNLKLNDDGSKIQSCCAHCAVLGKCYETLSYFRWTKEVEQRVQSNSTPSAPKIYHIPALGQDLVWLIIMAVIYFIILMLIEYDVFHRIFKQKRTDFRLTVDDNDVLEENERVSQLVKTATSSEEAMVVDNLCKSFGGSFSAVSKLSFGVHHGECFGLLGVNGAGKTTTFRMLTGDENPSNGNAYMNNVSLSSGRTRFMSMLGYCPQFDGFVEGLSGKEMLLLFARLRGIPGNRVEEEADKWLERTGLTASANVQCKKYSGGMKRRLSTAMALIGDAAVLLLDEPTCGVDPVARRQFWKIISSIKNSGQAIILTSHSMEECEALCSRLGIMVNGQMQCLGGVQHLKNKFAQGYSLTLKLKENALQENVQAITDSILQIFQPSSLKDHHQTTMKFQIHSRSLSWEELYGRMEKIKTDFQELIEEYVITETTLEEVFLSFARKQKVNEKGMINSDSSQPVPVGSSVSGTNSPNSETNNSTVSFNPETKNPGVTSVDTKF